MLADVQRSLARAFVAQATAEDAGVGVPAALRGLPRLSAAETLALYRSSIEEARHAALSALYPVCHALVGDACFRAIGRSLAGAEPSRHPDLGRIGEPLPELIETLDLLDAVPYLADVARLERAWNRAFVAAQPAPDVDAEAVGEALERDPAAWRFRLPPSACLVASPHPILAIWEAHQPGAPSDALERVDPGAAPDRLIVWRRALDVCIHRVEDADWPVLGRIEAGLDVSRVIADPGPPIEPDSRTLPPRSGVPEIEDEPAPELAAMLERIAAFFERGWIFAAEPLRAAGEGTDLS